MIDGMPPSAFHRFFLRDTQTVVELRWQAPEPAARTGLLARLGALLKGPDQRASPWHAVDHSAFDKAVDALSTAPDRAMEAFTRFGYAVTVLPADLQEAA